MAEKPMAKKKEFTEKNVEFAEGGDTPMFGKGDRTTTETRDAAGTQTPKQTAQHSTNNPKYATGGSTKMFGFAPAEPAKAGITSAR